LKNPTHIVKIEDTQNNTHIVKIEDTQNKYFSYVPKLIYKFFI